MALVPGNLQGAGPWTGGDQATRPAGPDPVSSPVRTDIFCLLERTSRRCWGRSDSDFVVIACHPWASWGKVHSISYHTPLGCSFVSGKVVDAWRRFRIYFS